MAHAAASSSLHVTDSRRDMICQSLPAARRPPPSAVRCPPSAVRCPLLLPTGLAALNCANWLPFGGCIASSMAARLLSVWQLPFGAWPLPTAVTGRECCADRCRHPLLRLAACCSLPHAARCCCGRSPVLMLADFAVLTCANWLILGGWRMCISRIRRIGIAESWSRGIRRGCISRPARESANRPATAFLRRLGSACRRHPCGRRTPHETRDPRTGHHAPRGAPVAPEGVPEPPRIRKGGRAATDRGPRERADGGHAGRGGVRCGPG